MVLGTWIDFFFLTTLDYSLLHSALLTFSAPLGFSHHALDHLESQTKADNCGFLQKTIGEDCLSRGRGLSQPWVWTVSAVVVYWLRQWI